MNAVEYGDRPLRTVHTSDATLLFFISQSAAIKHAAKHPEIWMPPGKRVTPIIKIGSEWKLTIPRSQSMNHEAEVETARELTNRARVDGGHRFAPTFDGFAFKGYNFTDNEGAEWYLVDRTQPIAYKRGARMSGSFTFHCIAPSGEHSRTVCGIGEALALASLLGMTITSGHSTYTVRCDEHDAAARLERVLGENGDQR